MFWSLNESIKSKCYTLSGYKQTNDVCLVYLECKLRQVKYGRRIFKLKWQKMVERTYLGTFKQQAKYP